MKVNDTNAGNIQELRKSEGAGQPGSRTHRAGERSADQVLISSLSSRLAAHGGGVTGPEHSSQIAKLSDAVAKGHYLVDSNAVSAKMIEEHLRPAAA